MIIYPDIEIQSGGCVHLVRGLQDQPIKYDDDPLEAAHRFVDQGAQWLHVVDLDAVFGTGDNTNLIQKIIRECSASVQVAGGIRTFDRIRSWTDVGAARVVIATAAVKYPALVTQAADALPDQIVVSIDARAGKVAIDGWREETAFTPATFAAQFADLPLAAIIYTDIDRDDDLPDSSISHTVALADEIRTPVIASGVIKSMDDISTLKYVPNISGAIVGRALFGRRIDLTEAIELAEQAPEPVAPFV